VDGVITPSERIGDDFGASLCSVHIPNFLETDRYLNQPAANHNGVMIGLGGDGNHFPGIQNSGVIPALAQVVQQRRQVKIVVFGGDQRIYDLLPVSRRHKLLWPAIEAAEWPHYLSRLDIGLAPLSGDFDQRSGSARLLEYMAMKIPWVASESSVYHKFGQFGWLVPNQPEAWTHVLLDVVDHLQDYRVEAAAEPYLYALSQDIDENINTILMAYEKIGS
jgi:glycosyltransferase involved in cell wall biosynthesis